MLLISYKKICSSKTTINLLLFILTARMAVGNDSSQMVVCLYKSKVRLVIRIMPRRFTMVATFVLMICSCLGENAGCSPAPTSATREVQKSISTIPVPPASTSMAALSANMHTESTIYTYVWNSTFQKDRSCIFCSLAQCQSTHN